MKNLKPEEHFFVYDNSTLKKTVNKEMVFTDELKVTEVENGCILPLRIRKDATSFGVSVFEGGVCDENLNFVAGHVRKRVVTSRQNHTCERGYIPNVPIVHKKETVVFGGILIARYGHMLAESLGRLWWYADHPDTKFKIVFLVMDLWDEPEFLFYDILEAIGIKREQIELIEVPTSFEHIVVPDESVFYTQGYNVGYKKIFDKIIENLPPSSHKKIYFSRSRFERKDGLNEQYYENFYRKRGFLIVFPEELSFQEKASLIHGAEEFVCTIQSGMHTIFCAKPGLKVTLLDRSGEIHICHFYPLIMRECDYSIISANFNFLSASHTGTNRYLYGPTNKWVEYLNKEEIPYSEEEVSLDIHLKPYIFEYIQEWGAHYATAKHYNRIKNNDLITILSNINMMFHDNSIRRKDYMEPDKITKLNDSIKKEKKAVTTLNTEKNLLTSLIKEALLENEARELTTIKETHLLECKYYEVLLAESKKNEKKLKKLKKMLSEEKIIQEKQKASLSAYEEELKAIKSTDSFYYVQRMKRFCSSNIFGPMIKKSFKSYMRKIREKERRNGEN